MAMKKWRKTKTKLILLTTATRELSETQDTAVNGRYWVFSWVLDISLLASATVRLESCPTQHTRLPSAEKLTLCTQPPTRGYETLRRNVFSIKLVFSPTALKYIPEYDCKLDTWIRMKRVTKSFLPPPVELENSVINWPRGILAPHGVGVGFGSISLIQAEKILTFWNKIYFVNDW